MDILDRFLDWIFGTNKRHAARFDSMVSRAEAEASDPYYSLADAQKATENIYGDSISGRYTSDVPNVEEIPKGAKRDSKGRFLKKAK